MYCIQLTFYDRLGKTFTSLSWSKKTFEETHCKDRSSNVLHIFLCKPKFYYTIAYLQAIVCQGNTNIEIGEFRELEGQHSIALLGLKSLTLLSS